MVTPTLYEHIYLNKYKFGTFQVFRVLIKKVKNQLGNMMRYTNQIEIASILVKNWIDHLRNCEKVSRVVSTQNTITYNVNWKEKLILV